MVIKRLSDKTINRIAAGEVVERPLAVVKELVENSIDADSTSITIKLENGGRNLIEISDNGIGMSKDDLSLAIERHATSKLQEDDINNIEFFGFRGEALPSIAAVSRMSIASRPRASEEAWEIVIEGGDKKSLQPTARNTGTTIKVNDLFAFTPARLRFLKSERAESAAIVDLIERIAYQNYGIEFLIYQDGKKLKHFKANENEDWINRAKVVFGESFADNMQLIDASYDGITIKGVVGYPTFNHKTSTKMYHYVNGRLVKDKLIIHASKLAYQNLMPGDRYPAFAVNIQLDPRLVDVNVHPTKAEIRFQDESKMRSNIISMFRRVLSSAPLHASTPMAEAILKKMESPNIQQPSPKHISSSYNIQSPSLNNFKSHKTDISAQINKLNFSKNIEGNESSSFKEKPNTLQPNPILFESEAKLASKNLTVPQEQQVVTENHESDIKNHFLGHAHCQIANTYIIAEAADGLVIIDQHAAHERIVLEKIKEKIDQNQKIESQALLVPSVVNLSALQAEAIESYLDELTKWGFHISKNGALQVVIRAVPAIMGQFDIDRTIRDIADSLHEQDDIEVVKGKFISIMGNIACKASIKAGRKLTKEEMNSLLEEMERTPLSGQCNHGRPTFTKISLKDLNRLFERE